MTVRRVPDKGSRPRPDDRDPLFLDAPLRPGLFPPTTVVVKPLPCLTSLRAANGHSLLFSPPPGHGTGPAHPVDTVTKASVRPMLSYVQVVCTPTADTPGASVLLHFDNRRYLFGSLSEGTQRILNQQKVGMTKLDNFFLSGPVTWANVGGILGLMLTIADVIASRLAPDANAAKKQKTKAMGVPPPSLKFYGAENITQVLATARRFVFRQGVPLVLNEVAHDPRLQHSPARSPDFEDANIKVWFVSLKPQPEATPQGRKRSHDDMVAEDRGQSLPADPSSKEEDKKKLLKHVVDAMFNSDWSLDALIPTTLHNALLPAAIFVKNEAGEVVNYTGPMPGNTKDPVPNIPVLVRTPWPATKISELPSTAPSTHSLCYIVKAQNRRGKFQVQQAQELGVKTRDFGQLTSGKTVKGKDGIDVTPAMCIAPDVEGRGFAFLDIPDPSYIDELLARPEWADKEITGTTEIMYWRLGAGVLQDPRLQAFMKEREAVRHHVFSPDVSPNGLVLRDAAVNMIRSHRIDPDRFPLPVFTNKLQGAVPGGVTVAQPGAKLQLAPQVKFHEDAILRPVQTAQALDTMESEVVQLADKARAKASDAGFLAAIEAAEQDIPNRDAEIITLGTGSALPSKYRNVSATLVRVPGVGSYLFDCGENTIGQLRRMYGFGKATEILRDLKVIWISHLHADHHLGTASIAAAWRDATASDVDAQGRLPRLAIVSHVKMIDWVREYAEIEDIGLDRIRLVPIAGRGARESVQAPWVPDAAHETFGLARIDSVRVDHCFGSLACVFAWPSGLRVAYSGDCRPSPAFARLGRGATLLIHEATLDDELGADARAKKHSTMSEALAVARDMGARRVLLTHFSQRYPRIANAHAQEAGAAPGGDAVADQAVVAAFDLMCVRLGDFRKAELFLPALRKLYEDAEDDETSKVD